MPLPSKRYILPAALIVATLGGQLLVSGYAFMHKLRNNGRLYHLTWPYMDYPMYSSASGPDISTQSARLFVEFADGRRLELDKQFMGVRKFTFRSHFIDRLDAPPITDPAKPDLAAKVELHRLQARDAVARQTQHVTGQRPAQILVERITHTLVDRHIVETHATHVTPVPPSTTQDDTTADLLLSEPAEGGDSDE